MYGPLCDSISLCHEIPENVHPHLFRHSRAMHLYQGGMDLTMVSQWLGHANLQTTLIIAHTDMEQKRMAIELAEYSGSPTKKNPSTGRHTVSDEETLKKLYEFCRSYCNQQCSFSRELQYNLLPMNSKLSKLTNKKRRQKTPT